MRRTALTTLWLLSVGMVFCYCSTTAFAQRDRTTRRAEAVKQVEAPPLEEFDVPANTPATLDSGMTLNPLLLRPVRDDTLGLQHQDRPAYFYALWLCQQIDTKSLSQLAAAFQAERGKARHSAPFVDIFQNPDEYRGRPVTLQGTLRNLVEFNPGPNDLGIETAYEGWVYADDAQGNPAVVVFTKNPAPLPLGGDLSEEVRFTGYFLKRYGYEARDTTRKAPMFLAGELEWLSARKVTAATGVSTPVYLVVTLVGLLAAWGLWRNRQPQPSSVARYNLPGRNFDDFPPQEFLDSGTRPMEPQH